MTLVDTHCHLNHPDFARDLADVLLRAVQAEVTRVVCVGYDLATSTLAAQLARDIRSVYATVGVHPHDAATFGPEVEKQLASLAADTKRVAAIGETGLDYYRNLSPRRAQQDSYRRHIGLAHRLDLPLVVHSREAQDDVIAILKEEGLPRRGVVMHCCPGDAGFARACLDSDCYLGVAGPITFQNAEELRDIVKTAPLERLMLETDAPYLTPHPHRGQRNEPSYVRLIADKLAKVKGLPSDEIAAQTTTNAQKLFRLEPVV